ncbi:ExbD/TolR family protein [Flagellimonas olearia]|uniref:Biopolymer transporter ExbD n=1 Tax=Flagellimonas olearia TaxID=552546 RepID=A0A444VIL2_9FLAO|nr:biopolymer transporter ExbD [Allomuricauda olearia]RYC50570.1 biopolymer transporter ExbD [Allomuricauda olearia]
MNRNRENPEVNAGSMADIAFLLLIFFLVTATIQTDVGLDRKLPPKETIPPPPVNERNIFRVSLNKNDELFVEDGIMELEDLKTAAMAFLDNGGIPKGKENHCGYCKGAESPDASDNPVKAVISFNSDREASYGMYVSVQDALTAAYNELRNRESQRLYGKNYVDMEESYYSDEMSDVKKMALQREIETIREMFPMKLSEAETISQLN